MSHREIIDEFWGDDEQLRDCIYALIQANDGGILVPHGVGEHARNLLSAAYYRLATSPQPPEE